MGKNEGKAGTDITIRQEAKIYCIWLWNNKQMYQFITEGNNGILMHSYTSIGI